MRFCRLYVVRSGPHGMLPSIPCCHLWMKIASFALLVTFSLAGTLLGTTHINGRRCYPQTHLLRLVRGPFRLLAYSPLDARDKEFVRTTDTVVYMYVILVEEAGLLEHGVEHVVPVGERFRSTVLGLGGSQHPMEVFKAFRGREQTKICSNLNKPNTQTRSHPCSWHGRWLDWIYRRLSPPNFDWDTWTEGGGEGYP